MTDGLRNDLLDLRIEVAVLGAGQTGRGFIGRLLAERGIPFLLIDQDDDLVGALRKKASYSVRFFGNIRPSIEIRDFIAMSNSSLPPVSIIKNLKTIFVSVGPSNLSSAGTYLERLAACRSELTDDKCDVITCENAPSASSVIVSGTVGPVDSEKDPIFNRAFRLMDAAVFCTTVKISPESIDIASEDYPYLECGVGADSVDPRWLSFLKPVADMESLMRRKLFTYNALSAILAYLGWWKGYSFLSEASVDAEIQAMMRDYLVEINAAIVSAMKIDTTDQEKFAERALSKFANPNIEDSIARNARDAARKLSQGERIIGSLNLLRASGRHDSTLREVAALMLLYAAEEKGLRPFSDAKSAAVWLAKVSGLAPGDAFVIAVGQRYVSLVNAGRGRLPS